MLMTPSRKEGLVEFCQDLVRTPSITGQEKAVAKKIAAKMGQLGYTGITIDEFGSVIGKVRGQSDSPVILFDGHMDTAPMKLMPTQNEQHQDSNQAMCRELAVSLHPMFLNCFTQVRLPT